MGLDGGCGCAGSSAVADIWAAAKAGDLAEVQQLVGQDPGLLNAGDGDDWTPLMHASPMGHMGVVRWLLDEGAAINERSSLGFTALWLTSTLGTPAVVRLLLERGADPTFADLRDQTPLMVTSRAGKVRSCAFCSATPAEWPPSTIALAPASRHCGWPAIMAVGGSCGRCSRAGPTQPSAFWASPPWPSPRDFLTLTTGSPPRAGGSAWLSWR
jgi:hypothetical protein